MAHNALGSEVLIEEGTLFISFKMFYIINESKLLKVYFP